MAEMNCSAKRFGKAAFVVLSMSAASFALSGCDLTRNHLKMDRSGMMDMQDYRDALAPRVAEQDAASTEVDQGAPEFQNYVADRSSNLKPMPLVSIQMNNTVPLRDALFELAAQADYDIQLDPAIIGSIIFTARNRPFDEVIERISDIAGLRYKFDNDSVRVELDTPYHKTYKIDYLSYVRKNTSSIKNDISVVSGEGANTGSKFEAQSTSEADFWKEMEGNLTQILGVVAVNMRTSTDPTITAAATNPVTVDPVIAPGPDGQPIVQAQAPQATLNIQSLPTSVGNAPSSSAGGSGAGTSAGGSGFALNKQAGIIAINGTERQHKMIAEYLAEVRRSVTSQVLIEAKILEVSLNDQYAAGINWGALNRSLGEFNLSLTSAGAVTRPLLEGEATLDTNFQIGYTGNDVQALVDAISRFGTVKALSSPRMTVLNNQSAVLNVADNRVYFELDVERERSTDPNIPDVITVDSEIRNVPEGVMINVQPSIDLDSKAISMAVRPTVTRIVDFVPDPGVAYLNAGVVSDIPVVNIQEMDSVVRINSGQAMVMGGLMQDRTESTQNGVPVLSEVPLFGAAFRNQVDNVRKTELVIFLKATIVDGTTLDNTDRDMYKRFSGDRRPFSM